MASTLGLHNPLRYRGYVYDRETGLYYLQSRYYNPEWGRFLNADWQLTSELLGGNLFAYCLNNPIMMYDPTGEIGILTILGAFAVLTLVISIPSSDQLRPTKEQIEAAENEAEQAKYSVVYDSAGNQTIHIQIQTEDVLNNVDYIARDHYYQSLYDKSVQIANEKGIPTENLMTVRHITWEFNFHVVAYHLDFESALVTDLDSDETPWSMLKRAMGR